MILYLFFISKKEQILEARERHLESIASTSSRKIEVRRRV